MLIASGTRARRGACPRIAAPVAYCYRSREQAFRTEAPDADIPIHAGIPLGAAMKLKQLQALRAVAETGSLQGAAGRLSA